MERSWGRPPPLRPHPLWGLGVLPCHPDRVFILVLCTGYAGRAGDGVRCGEPGMARGDGTHSAGGSYLQSSRARLWAAPPGSRAGWTLGHSPAERLCGYPNPLCSFLRTLSHTRQHVLRGRTEDGAQAEPSSPETDNGAVALRQEGGVANAGEGLSLGFGKPGLATHCCPTSIPQPARVHLPLGECLPPSSLPEGLPLPAAASMGGWVPRQPPALGTEPVRVGQGRPAGLSTRPLRCSVLPLLLQAHCATSSLRLPGPKSSSARGPPSAQAPHAGTGSRSSGPSGLWLLCP